MNRLADMKRPVLFIIIVIAFAWAPAIIAQPGHTEPTTLAPGARAPDFTLGGVDGRTYSISSFDKARVLVVIFSCNHCPTAQAYEDRIIDLSNDYRPRGVEVVMISPNSVEALNYSEMGYSDMGDSFDDMVQRAKDKAFPFPYLYDGDDQEAALAYGPVATPHCFVFDSDRILRYAGRIDGSEKPGTGRGEDIRDALDAVLAGKAVSDPVTKVFGCSVKWAWKDEYTRKLYREWSELPVNLEEIDAAGVRELVRNNSDRLRLINIWASWCGPCVGEMDDFVIIDRMYRNRQFELITVSADKTERKADALRILKDKEASNKNYIFSGDDIYELIEAVDPQWQGALPYTMLIEPGGAILYRKHDTIDPLQMKKLIVGSKSLGRYY